MRAFRTNILRMIRSTKSRFFSLTAIVAIGTAFFVGVSATSLVMGRSVDFYNDEQNLKDITIYSNYGFEEEDLEAIRNHPDTLEAEGTWFADVIGTDSDSARITRVHALMENGSLNRPVLREGRMPEKPDEALAEGGSDIKGGFPIGSVVYFSYPEGTSNDSLKIEKATVVGLLDTPVYLNMSKENSTLSNQYIDTYLYVPQEAFDSSYYTEVNITVRGLKEMYSFSKEYDDAVADAAEDYEALAEKWQDRRRKEIADEAEEEYQKGLQEYKDGLKQFEEEIADAEKEIADGEKEIEEGREALAEGEQELADGMALMERKRQEALQQLADAQALVDENRRKLQQAEADFAKTKEDLLKQRKQLEDNIPQLQQAKDGLAQIDAALPQVEEGIAGLEDPMVSVLMEIFRTLPADTEISEITSGMREAADAAEQLQEVLPEADEEVWQELLTDGEALKAEIAADNVYFQAEETKKLLKSLDKGKETADSGELEILKEKILRYDPAADTETPKGIQAGYDNASLRAAQADEILQKYDTEPVRQILHEIVMGGGPGILREMADTQIDELVSSLQQISGRESITDAGTLVSAYDESLQSLHETRDTLLESRKQITDALADQGIAPEELDDVIQKASDGIGQIDAGIAEGERQLAEGRAQIDEGQRQIDEGYRQLERELNEAQNAFSNGAAEIAANRSRLDDAVNELASGRAELEKARKEGREELEKAKKKLDEAREQIDALEPGEWTVLDRSTSHYATVTYRGSVDQMRAIGNIFPLFFIAVAALVCLTTMTRMVDEQRGEIGILRALGYTEGQCASKYLIYAGSATLLGGVIGIVFGMMTFPIIIYHVWRMMYVLPPIRVFMPWNLALSAGASFLAGMELTTWLTCRKDMREVPSQLMRPKSPKLGRKTLLERIGFIWSRLSFTWKVTMRNLFRYKRRFFMTVAGVAGCAALLVTGFGIRDSINRMVDLQFYEISRFDGSVSLEKNLSAEERSSLLAQLQSDPDIEEITAIGSYTAKIASGKKEETVSVEIYENSEDVCRCYDLRKRIGGAKIELGDDAIVISEKLSELLGLKAGDTVRLEGETGKYAEVKIGDICELYINHYAFMSQDCYEKLFGISPRSHSLHLRLSEDLSDSSALQRRLVEYEQIEGIAFFEAVLENFRTMVKGLDLIVWTLIVSSMSLAFVVLGNLINVNLSERMREIATLKVLGFRRREVENYIYKENNVLTLIGAVCGLPVGNVLHHYIMRMVEMDYVMFGRSIMPASFAISLVLTLFFSILVDFVMARRLHSIKMVESLKSVE